MLQCLLFIDTTPPHEQVPTQYLSEWIWIGWNSALLHIYHTKVKENSLNYYLPITRKIIIGFIYFLSVLALCEMLTDPFRFCTRVNFFISTDDAWHTTSASFILTQ